MVKYLPKKQLILINEKLLRFFGKEKGKVNDMYVEAVIAASKSYPGEGKDALLAKAAIMLERIVVMKPFSSGNDRTAYEAARVFLEMNGLVLEAEEKEIVALLMGVAGLEKDIAAVHRWLAQHTPSPEKKAKKGPAEKRPAGKRAGKPAEKKTYAVYVDDNSHHGDKSERYKLGDFRTCEEAVKACKKIVDEFFEKAKPGESSYKELWSGYMMYGEDPFIVCDDEGCGFSAWDYARQKCKELSKK